MKNVFNLVFKKVQYLILGLMFIVIFSVVSLQNSARNNLKTNNIELINNLYFKKTLNYFYSNLNPKNKEINHRILGGENINVILKKYNLNTKENKKISEILVESNEIKNLKINDVIEISIDQSKNKVLKFSIPLSKSKNLILTRGINELNFKKDIVLTNLEKKIIYSEDKIFSSLYKSAVENKIPVNIIIDFAQIYGFQIDFQRDIKKKDTYQILYEIFVDKNNKTVRSGRILYANLILNGQDNSLYYFDNRDFFGHYDRAGKSVKKALMKTPINGARLSSSFGMRKHPIDGYNKMHKGTDFAAPLGTPIMASGDGIITKVGWCGGGGNCIKIKHNKTYQTVYAHMSKFASGIKKGIRVKQGQTIGFVGSTGKSTGPHLHYEVIVNNKRVNSQKLKLPSGKTLKNELRKDFETQKIKLDVLKSEKIIGLF